MKKFLAILLAALMIVSAFACTAPKTEDDKPADNQQGAAATNVEAGEEVKPLKVGVLVSGTGAYAAMGPQGQAAMDAFMGLYNNGLVAGRQIELIVEDDESDTTLGVQKAQKLVEQEGCEVIIGPMVGSISTAVKEYAGTQPDVTFIMGGGSDTITYGTVYPNIFRTCESGAQSCFMLGDYAYDDLGYRKVIAVAPDSDFQYSCIAGFKSTFLLKGGEFDCIWFPESGNDFSSLIAQIPDDADAVFLAGGGANGIDFLKQYKEFGKTQPIIAIYTVMDSGTISNPVTGAVMEAANAQGPCAIPGDSDSEVYNAIKKCSMEALGYTVSTHTATVYDGLAALAAGLEASGGKSDSASLCEALKTVEFQGSRGTTRFDENGQIILTYYMCNLAFDEESQTYYTKKIPDLVYEDCGQFGPFDPAWWASLDTPDRNKPTKETIMGAVLAN